MDVFGDGVAFDMVDRLQATMVPESDVVRRLLGPTVTAYRAELFVVFLDDVNPRKFTLFVVSVA